MLELLDSNLLRGVALILMILAFLGIWVWAWSRNREETFHHASRLPLEEDDGRVPHQDSEMRTKE